MRLFLFLFSFFFAAGDAFAQLKTADSLEQAFAQARVSGKIVFIEYYNSECPHCQKLEPLIQSDSFSRFYNDKFICYRINSLKMDSAEQKFLDRTKLKITAVPAMLFFFPDEKFCHFSHTRQDLGFLLQVGQHALDPSLRMSAQESKYTNGDRSIRCLFALCNYYELFGNDSMQTIAGRDLYKSFPKKDLGSKKSFTILKTAINSAENGFFTYWYANRDKSPQPYPETVLSDVFDKYLNGFERKNWDLKKLLEMKAVYQNLNPAQDADKVFWEQEVALMSARKGDAEGLKLAHRMLDTQRSNAAKIYVAGKCTKIFSSPADLMEILGWLAGCKPLDTETNAMADWMLYRTQLLEKTFQYDDAREQLSKAILYYFDHNLDLGPLKPLQQRLMP